MAFEIDLDVIHVCVCVRKSKKKDESLAQKKLPLRSFSFFSLEVVKETIAKGLDLEGKEREKKNRTI